MVTTPTSAEQRVLLNNISWQTFETLLAEIGDNRAPGSLMTKDSWKS